VLLSTGCSHVDVLIAAYQVSPFDELDAHLPGKERVLEIRGVVDARRQQHDARIVDARGGRRPQRLEKALRIVGDAADPMAGEQLGEDMRHRAPVLDDVRDARRRAQVVLENAKAT
jgi:hypothetical protein